MLCTVQTQQPWTQSPEVHETSLCLTHSLCNVVLCVGEALGIGAVYNLQVVEDGEDWDGGELVFHRLQPLLPSLPELEGGRACAHYKSVEYYSSPPPPAAFVAQWQSTGLVNQGSGVRSSSEARFFFYISSLHFH